MKRERVILGSKRIVVITVQIIFLIVSFNISLAEMRIITNDGRIHIVPVQAGDIQRIEFTEQINISAGYKYLGCYRDQSSTSGRDLSGYFLNDSEMTTEKCASLCRDRGFLYAGTQFSNWCFCGNSYGRSGQANNCDMRCAGNNAQICGGSWANSVYSVK